MILFGALHLYLQQIYLFFIFFGLNVVMGLYALIVYFFLSFHTLTWKHKHYPIKEEVEPLSIPEEPEFFNDSIDMYSSQQSLIPRTSTKNQLEPPPIQMVPLKTSSPQHDTAPTTTVSSQSSFVKPSLPRSIKRKQKSRHDSSLMESPLVEVIKEEKEGDSDSEQSGAYNVGVESEGEESGSHMDNLMFAIKTGVTYSDRDEDEEPVGLLRSPPQSSSSEQYRLRRISIADTHL
jgi:G-protein coupled receptor 98